MSEPSDFYEVERLLDAGERDLLHTVRKTTREQFGRPIGARPPPRNDRREPHSNAPDTTTMGDSPRS